MLLKSQQERFNRACLGRVLPVLFDRAGRHPGQLAGRSPYLQAVHAKAPDSLLGEVVDVHVAECSEYSLGGVIAGFDEARAASARSDA